MSEEFKILEPEFDKSGWHFKQLIREGDKAIYLKTKRNIKSYEVIVIKDRPAYTIANINFCAGQSYPSPEMWGVNGFTFTDEKLAYKKFEELKNPKIEKPAKTELNLNPENQPPKRKRGRPRKNINL